MPIKWQPSLEIGIPVIDSQHQRIVFYINRLEHAHTTGSREEIEEVLHELVDYTLSHFAFEESLMEEAGYPFVKAHKRVHDLFTRRVSDYQQRFKMGEEISGELLQTLTSWLLNHISSDDRDYADAVHENLEKATNKVRRKGLFARLFKRE